MRKDKLLMIIILVLVLLNSATLIIMWVNKPPFPPHPPHHERPDKIIIERLQLDESQQKQFEKLKNEHHSFMMKLDKESKELHEKYFALLKDEVINDSLEHFYQKQLAANAEYREELTFHHFEELKKICKPNQLKLFNEFIDELGKILGPPKGPPPPPK